MSIIVRLSDDLQVDQSIKSDSVNHCYVMHAIQYVSNWEALRMCSNLLGDNLKEMFQLEAVQILSLESSDSYGHSRVAISLTKPCFQQPLTQHNEVDNKSGR